jgi:hypothetical protein
LAIGAQVTNSYKPAPHAQTHPLLNFSAESWRFVLILECLASGHVS